MHNLQPGLVKRRILACIARPERQIALAKAFADADIEVTFALGRTDCLRLVQQELPHIVVCESELQDGTAIDVFDAIRKNPLFKAIPVVALAARRSKEEIGRLGQRAFAEVMNEEVSGSTLNKLVVRMDGLLPIAKRGMSPYFCYAPGLESDKRVELNASLEAEVLGQMGSQLVVSTMSELDLSGSIEFRPRRTSPSAPLELSCGVAHKTKHGILNLFPIHRTTGTGRNWALNVNKIGGPSGPGQSPVPMRKLGPILVIDPTGLQSVKVAETLTRYGVTATSVSLNELEANDGKMVSTASVLLFTEMDGEVAKMAWRSAWLKLGYEQRPVIVSLTGSIAPKSQPKLQFLQKPVPLGRLIDTIEAATTQASAVLGQFRPADRPQPFPVFFGTSGRLIGIDEAAAYVEFPRMMMRGTRLDFGCPLLDEVWQGTSSAIVTASVVGRSLGLWEVRLEPVIQAGLSKWKRYERVTKSLAGSHDDAA